jgi:hypothetical protein
MGDLELLGRMLQSCLEDRRVKLVIFTACIALLVGIGLEAVMTDSRIEGLLVQEIVVAMIILLLFIATKPPKPSNPQHPLPSHEPPQLMRRIKSRQSADGFRL